MECKHCQEESWKINSIYYDWYLLLSALRVDLMTYKSIILVNINYTQLSMSLGFFTTYLHYHRTPNLFHLQFKLVPKTPLKHSRAYVSSIKAVDVPWLFCTGTTATALAARQYLFCWAFVGPCRRGWSGGPGPLTKPLDGVEDPSAVTTRRSTVGETLDG